MRLFCILLLLLPLVGCRSTGAVEDSGKTVEAAARVGEVVESTIYEGDYNDVLAAAERAASEIGRVRRTESGIRVEQRGADGSTAVVDVRLYQMEHSRVQVEITVSASGQTEASMLLRQYLRALDREVRN